MARTDLEDFEHLNFLFNKLHRYVKKNLILLIKDTDFTSISIPYTCM